MKIYLAGPISGLSYTQATDWREYAEIKLTNMGHTVFNPMREKEHAKHIQELSNENGTDNGRKFWLQDKSDIEHSDLLFVNFKNCKIVSIGTCVEIGMAVQLRIPIIVIMEHDNIHGHPFITEPAKIITDSLDDAIYFIGEYYEAG